MASNLAIILKGYPRLSETFIAQEIRALELRGFKLHLYALRHPSDPTSHPIHQEIQAKVSYLPEYVIDDIPRIIKAWWKVRRLPGYRQAKQAWRRDLKSDATKSRWRRFAQALVLANELPDSIQHLYAHFMHTPASVTYYASLIKQKPWSISAHAKDIWTIDDWEKKLKLASVDWLVTCTATNAKHLSQLAANPAKVSLLYHGLDFSRFNKAAKIHSKNSGNDADNPIVIVSVGRAVNKKGYDFLLTALAQLAPTLHWQFNHIGSGELLDDLKQQAQALKIDDKINWLGGVSQLEVLDNYRRADIFVLASRISPNGDRDGLPNVLMEAQSQQLACLSTNISGIPELIEHQKTGCLVPEQDADALALALQRLMTDPQLRRDLAMAGFKRVKQHFSLTCGIDQLAALLSKTVSKQ